MAHFFELLVGTVLLRPYVFVFLALYLFVASREMGWRRTGLYICLAYSLAWICEKGSITIGRPTTLLRDVALSVHHAHEHGRCYGPRFRCGGAGNPDRRGVLLHIPRGGRELLAAV